MTPPSDDVLVECHDAILRVTFNHPQSLNAFTTTMLDRAADAVERGGNDPSVRVIVLTGAGRAFSAGADLAGRDQTSDGSEMPGVDTLDAANRLTMAIRRAPKPVVAAVNGPAAGVGCSFALAADITLATQSSYLLLAFANIGLMPDGGATGLLPAAIGRARALHMAMLAERIPAPRAVEWGLIADVFPDDDFVTEVERLITRLAQGPTISYAKTKHAINATVLAHLPHALETEREGQTALFHTQDFTEGVAAFRDKRTPQFTGQ